MSQNDSSFFDRLDQFGANIALIENDRQINYAEFVKEADAFSEKLAISRGLIFLEARNTIEAVTAYVGCLRGGHVVHLLGEGDETRLQALLDTYRPNVVVRHDETGQTIERRHDEPITLHPDLAVLLSTSGSTGSPKFVKLSKKNITSNALAIAEYLGLDHTERAITTLKFNYSYGLSVIHSHLACGASVVLTDASVTAPDFSTLFAAQAATSFAGVPYTFEILQRHHDWAELPSLRYVTQAGGRLAPEIVRHMGELGQQNNWRFFVMYGQTEAAPRMAWLPPEHTIDHPDCIGRAVPGGTLSIISEDGTLVTGPDTPGELIYAGPNVMMGYAENAAGLSTDETPPHLKTGDIAVRTSEGLFRIVGRSSRFIKPFGVRINLDELQAQVRQRAPDAVCTGSDAQLIVAVPEEAAEDTPELIRWLAESYGLPAFMIAVVSVKTIPLLANGKIDYQAILRLAPSDEPAAQSVPAVAGNRKWESIQAIFGSLTGARAVGNDSTFLTLAADSLSYVVTSLAVEEYLGFLPADWETMTVSALEKLRNGGSEVAAADRLHYLNASRILMLLLGIPYHAAMVFTFKTDWIISAPVKSGVATAFASFTHSFRMFAFFFLSGWFAMLILKKTDVKTWLGKQAGRLAIPMVLSSLVLAPLEMGVEAIAPGEKSSPPFAFWLDGLTALGPQWLTHRWFLVTLLAFAVILAGLVTLSRQGRFNRLPEFLGEWLDRHPRLFWTMLLIGVAPYGLASALLGKDLGHDWDFVFGIFEWRTIISYAPAFFLGVALCLRPKTFAWFLKPSIFSVCLGVVLCAAFIILDETKSFPGKILESANWIACGLLGTRLFLSAMHRWVNNPHPWIPRLLDASYVIYLWHMVFVLLFSSICIRLHINPLLSVILTAIATFGCSWLVYVGVSRSRILSLIFNGGPLRRI